MFLFVCVYNFDCCDYRAILLLCLLFCIIFVSFELFDFIVIIWCIYLLCFAILYLCLLFVPFAVRSLLYVIVIIVFVKRGRGLFHNYRWWLLLYSFLINWFMYAWLFVCFAVGSLLKGVLRGCVITVLRFYLRSTQTQTKHIQFVWNKS